MRCFERKGYTATSIADITAEASVAKGTFYVHYEDKAAILDETLASFNQELAANLSSVLAVQAGAPLERLVEALAAAFLSHWQENGPFVRAYAERSAAGLDVKALPFGLNEPTRRVLVAALVARLGPRATEVDPELAIHAVVAMWLRLGLQLVFRPELDADRVVRVLVPLTVGAVSALAPG